MENEQIESTINLQELFILIKKNIFLIIGVTILFTVLIGLYTYNVIDKKYASETTLRISVVQNEGELTYNDILTSQKLVTTYSKIVTTEKILNKVTEALKNDNGITLTNKQLKSSLNVTPIPDTDMIQIKVTMLDSKHAEIVANKVAQVFINEVKNEVNIYVLDSAYENTDPISPNLKLNLVIGFVLGAMVSIGYVLIKEFMDRTIKTEEDVKKYLNIPILGVIPTYDRNYGNK